MNSYAVPIKHFDWQGFTQAMVDFVTPEGGMHYLDPAYFIMKVDPEKDVSWYPKDDDTQRDFMQELQNGVNLFFYFSGPCVMDEPVACADGVDRWVVKFDDEKDEDVFLSKLPLDEYTTLGFLVSLHGDALHFHSALHSAPFCHNPLGRVTLWKDCDTFDRAIEDYLKRFIRGDCFVLQQGDVKKQ